MSTIPPQSTTLTQRVFWVVVTIAAIIYFFFAWRNYHFAFDDAMIYQRYITNLVHGDGLVFNPGDRFNGLTSPGYTLPLALLALITRNPRLSAWLICSISGFCAAIVWFGLFRSAIRQYARLPFWVSEVCSYVGLILSLILPFFFLTYGMETTLYALISGMVLRQYTRERFASAAFLAGLLLAIRMEGGALLLGLLVHQLVYRKKLPSFLPKLAGLLVAFPVLVFGFNWTYYGAPLAETGMAKLWQGESGFWGHHSFLVPPDFMMQFVFGGNHLIAYSIGILALIGLFGLRRTPLGFVTTIYLSIYTAVFVGLNIPNYHWYYGPYFSELTFLATFGVVYVAASVGRASHRSIGVGACVLLAIPVAACTSHAIHYDLHPSGPDETYVRIGKWLNKNTPPSARVALAEVGFVGYYSDRYIIDILGLVNKKNAREIGEQKLDGWLNYYQPDYIVVHTPTWPLEYSLYAAALKFGVVQVCDFSFPPFRLFRISHRPGTGTTCDGGNWIPITGSRTNPPSPSRPSTAFAGYVVTTQANGNAVRIDIALDQSAGKPAHYILAYASAYGMAEPVLTGSDVLFPSQPIRDWRLTAFFPTEVAASDWAKTPDISVVDGDGHVHRVSRTNLAHYSNAISTHLTNKQCSLDAINGKSAKNSVIVTADSNVTFGGWAGDGKGQAVGNGVLILRGSERSYSVSFITNVARPDVAKALDSNGMADSGFNLSDMLSGVSAGAYSLFLAKPNDPNSVCDLHRILTVQ